MAKIGPFQDADLPASGYGEAKVFSFRVEAYLRCGERETVVSAPLYELPLLTRKWQMNGGRCEIRASWPRAKIKGARIASRRLALTSLQWQAEVERMQRENVIRLPGMQQAESLFDSIYGTDGSGLKETVFKQYEAWKDLEARCQKEGHREPTDAEVTEIALQPLGKLQSAAEIEMVDIDMEAQASAGTDEGAEPLEPTEAELSEAAADVFEAANIPKGVAKILLGMIQNDGEITGPVLEKHRVIGPALRKDPELLGRIFGAVAELPATF